MGRLLSSLGTLFDKENKWWEEEKQRQQQQQQQQSNEKGPAYTKAHNPNDAYNESQENVKNAIRSVSEGPGQNNTNVTTSQAPAPYVIKNRDFGSLAFGEEATTFAKARWQNNSTKMTMFNRLHADDKAKVMESQNPDNMLNNIYQKDYAWIYRER